MVRLRNIGRSSNFSQWLHRTDNISFRVDFISGNQQSLLFHFISRGRRQLEGSLNRSQAISSTNNQSICIRKVVPFIYLCITLSFLLIVTILFLSLIYKNLPTPAKFSVYFQSFQSSHYIILQQINVKNVHPVSGAGSQTRNLPILSLFP